MSYWKNSFISLNFDVHPVVIEEVRGTSKIWTKDLKFRTMFWILCLAFLATVSTAPLDPRTLGITYTSTPPLAYISHFRFLNPPITYLALCNISSKLLWLPKRCLYLCKYPLCGSSHRASPMGGTRRPCCPRWDPRWKRRGDLFPEHYTSGISTISDWLTAVCHCAAGTRLILSSNWRLSVPWCIRSWWSHPKSPGIQSLSVILDFWRWIWYPLWDTFFTVVLGTKEFYGGKTLLETANNSIIFVRINYRVRTSIS